MRLLFYLQSLMRRNKHIAISVTLYVKELRGVTDKTGSLCYLVRRCTTAMCSSCTVNFSSVRPGRRSELVIIAAQCKAAAAIQRLALQMNAALELGGVSGGPDGVVDQVSGIRVIQQTVFFLETAEWVEPERL